MGNKKGTTYINSILSFLTCGLLLLAFITGCSDNLLPSDDMKSFSNQQRSSKIYSGTYGGQLTKYSQDPVVQAAEEPFIELSKKIAGFAGYHLTKEGKLVALVKNAENIATAKQKILSYVGNRYQNSYLQFSLSQLQIKNVAYSYTELSHWRDIIIEPVLSTDGVTKIDLAEDENRLVVGVENVSDVSAVESVVEKLDVPEEAIHVEVTGKIKLLRSKRPKYNKIKEAVTASGYKYIYEKFRPIPGGVQIQIFGVGEICTYGFNAKWQNKDVFITNSHCTDSPWSLNQNANFYQNLISTSNNIGTEIYDPNGWNCLIADICRYSDAAVIELTSGVNGEAGKIARTNGRGISWTPGSRLIWNEGDRFRIVMDDTDLLINMPLNKMGRTSGWTLGYVDDTCVTYSWGEIPNSIILCQTAVRQMYLDAGDSGSPVFYYDATQSSWDVELAGILWGSIDSQELAVISPMDNIRFDLGNMITTDKPVSVTISGPGYIDNTGVFNWDAVVDNEQGIVSYQWKIKWEGTSTWNTLGTASSQSVTVNNDTNFNLKVIVTDDIESATAFRTVTVNLGDCEPFEPCQD